MKKIINVVIIALLFAINLIGQAPSGEDELMSKKEIVGEAKAQISKMSVMALNSMMEDNEDFLLVDVRTEEEYLAGHIKGAVWIPRGKLEFVIQSVTENPNAALVLYCRSGNRSALSVVSVMDVGYKNVANLTGGFRAWTEAGYHAFNRHGEFKVVAFEKKETEKEN